MKNINSGAHFLFLLILCSIKIERLLFLKFLKNLAFFDSYFWPFSKFEEKIKVIFVISAILSSIWNLSIEFRWHDEKLIYGISPTIFQHPNRHLKPFYSFLPKIGLIFFHTLRNIQQICLLYFSKNRDPYYKIVV